MARTADAMCPPDPGLTIIQGRPARMTRSDTNRPDGVSMMVTAPGSTQARAAGLVRPDWMATMQACADFVVSAANIKVLT